jgi:hypothetical protein
MNPTEHAAHLRQTSALMEQSARALERVSELEATNMKLAGDNIRLMSSESDLKEMKNYADDQLTHLAKFLGLHGMTWAHVVSEAVSRIEKQESQILTWRERYDKEVCTKRKMREQAVSALERVVELEAMDRKLGEARATIATLRRENETLARNVPPEPPADDPIFWNPYNGAVQDHRDGTVIQPDTDKERAKRGLPPLETESPVLIGQQWCRSGRTAPDDGVVLNYPDGWVVLCSTYQSADGTLTYRPLAVRDLPEVSAI